MADTEEKEDKLNLQRKAYIAQQLAALPGDTLNVAFKFEPGDVTHQERKALIEGYCVQAQALAASGNIAGIEWGPIFTGNMSFAITASREAIQVLADRIIDAGGDISKKFLTRLVNMDISLGGVTMQVDVLSQSTANTKCAGGRA